MAGRVCSVPIENIQGCLSFNRSNSCRSESLSCYNGFRSKSLWSGWKYVQVFHRRNLHSASFRYTSWLRGGAGGQEGGDGVGAVGRGAGHRSMKLGGAVGGEGAEFVAVSAQGALVSAVWAEGAGGGGSGFSSCRVSAATFRSHRS